MDAFRAKYGPKSKEILPAVMAAAPMLLIKASQLKALESKLVALEKQNAQLQAKLTEANEALQAARQTAISANEAEIAAVAQEIAKVEQTPLRTVAATSGKQLSKEEIMALKEELILSHDVARDYFRNPTKEIDLHFEPYRRLQHNTDFFDLIQYIEKGDEKSALKAFRIYVDKYGPDYGTKNALPEFKYLFSDMVTTYQKEGYSVNFIRKFIPKLKRFSEIGTRTGFFPKFYEYATRRILSKSGLFGVGVLTLGLMSFTTLDANAQGVAQRIAEQPDLFIYASPDELRAIEEDELASNTAREIADVLHAANNLSAQDMQFIAENTQSQQEKSKRDIAKSLQTLRTR